MKNKKVSVIVPIYNTEKYLNRTIDSLVRQTLKDIEIILVDDGSSDNSSKICDDYAKKDSRIIVIHIENSGQAIARNVALEVASGKYVMFLDADDMLEDIACEVMYNLAEEKDADYVSANYIMMDEFDKKIEKPAFDTKMYGDFEFDLNNLANCFGVMNSTLWNKIYNFEFLNKNNIKFDINPPSEDDYFTTLAYMKAKRGYYTSKVICDYRHNPNSTSNICDKKYFQKQNDVYKTIYNNFKENEKMGFYRYYYAKKNAYLICKIIDSDAVTAEEKKDILKQYQWFFSLADDLKVPPTNENLIPIFQSIKDENYEDALKQMEAVKQDRRVYSVFEKSRSYFPTTEHYKEMSKYDYEFINKKEDDLYV